MKNKMKYTIVVLFAALMAVSATAASYHSVVEDASIAFRIYNGDDANVVLTVTGTSTNYAFEIDGNSTDVPGQTGDNNTIAELVAALEACTNAAGSSAADLGIFIDQDMSLAADLVDDEIQDQVVTITPGTWGNVLWDTSIASGPGWNVYIPDNAPKGVAGWGDIAPALSGGYTITRVTGAPGGTGTGTTSIYLNRTLVWQQNDTTGTTHNINVNTELNIPVAPGEAAIIRAERGTTETTGVLTVIAE